MALNIGIWATTTTHWSSLHNSSKSRLEWG